jgi:plastocyanin
MTRIRSILLGAGTSLVLVLSACGSDSTAGLAGSSSAGGSGGSSAPAAAGNSSVGASGGSSAPAAVGTPAVGGSGAAAGAGNSVPGGFRGGGPGVVAVRSGTAATTVKETDYLTFVPALLTVKVGDIVVFTNSGAIAHNVTFPYAGLGSPTMNRGNSYLVRFTSPGTYKFVCTLHFAGMLGTITVK